MNLALLQPVAWCAAFWTALLLYSRRARPARPIRFACALVLGAALAHAGWLLLHLPALAPALRARPQLALDPLVGFCVLFVPLGPLLLERSAPAFASLPFAFAVARLGCLAAGCCAGLPTRPGSSAGQHPVALYEIAGWLALGVAVSRADARCVAPLVLAGFGALRLLLDPLRSIPALGAPVVPPLALAGAWGGVAAFWLWRVARQGLAHTTLKSDQRLGMSAAPARAHAADR